MGHMQSKHAALSPIKKGFVPHRSRSCDDILNHGYHPDFNDDVFFGSSHYTLAFPERRNVSPSGGSHTRGGNPAQDLYSRSILRHDCKPARSIDYYDSFKRRRNAMYRDHDVYDSIPAPKYSANYDISDPYSPKAGDDSQESPEIHVPKRTLKENDTSISGQRNVSYHTRPITHRKLNETQQETELSPHESLTYVSDVADIEGNITPADHSDYEETGLHDETERTFAAIDKLYAKVQKRSPSITELSIESDLETKNCTENIGEGHRNETLRSDLDGGYRTRPVPSVISHGKLRQEFGHVSDDVASRDSGIQTTPRLSMASSLTTDSKADTVKESCDGSPDISRRTNNVPIVQTGQQDQNDAAKPVHGDMTGYVKGECEDTNLTGNACAIREPCSPEKDQGQTVSVAPMPVPKKRTKKIKPLVLQNIETTNTHSQTPVQELDYLTTEMEQTNHCLQIRADSEGTRFQDDYIKICGSIPQYALRENQIEILHFCCHSPEGLADQIGPQKQVLSDVYEFLPHGIRFQTPITLRFPHRGMETESHLDMNMALKITVMYSNTLYGDTANWLELNSSDGHISSIITEEEVCLFLRSFCLFAVIGEPVPAKFVEILVYGKYYPARGIVKLTIRIKDPDKDDSKGPLIDIGRLIEQHSLRIVPDVPQIRISIESDEEWTLKSVSAAEQILETDYAMRGISQKVVFVMTKNSENSESTFFSPKVVVKHERIRTFYLGEDTNEMISASSGTLSLPSDFRSSQPCSPASSLFYPLETCGNQLDRRAGTFPSAAGVSQNHEILDASVWQGSESQTFLRHGPALQLHTSMKRDHTHQSQTPTRHDVLPQPQASIKDAPVPRLQPFTIYDSSLPPKTTMRHDPTSKRKDPEFQSQTHLKHNPEHDFMKRRSQTGTMPENLKLIDTKDKDFIDTKDKDFKVKVQNSPSSGDENEYTHLSRYKRKSFPLDKRQILESSLLSISDQSKNGTVQRALPNTQNVGKSNGPMAAVAVHPQQMESYTVTPSGGVGHRTLNVHYYVQPRGHNGLYSSEFLNQARKPPKLSHKIKMELCRKLDQNRPDGKDWRALAEQLDFGRYLSQFPDHPTWNLLELWESMDEVKGTKQYLIESLIKIGRSDAADVASEESKC